MASYRLMCWRGIPSQVKAVDETGATASVMLPPFFMQEIDRLAMAEGLVGSDEYLEAWVWSDEMTREGTADEVAATVAAEAGEAWRRENDGG
jgi:hypothetical protein